MEEKRENTGSPVPEKTEMDFLAPFDEDVEQIFHQATDVAEDLMEKVEEVAPFTKHGLARLLAPSIDAFNPDRELTAKGKISRIFEQFVRFAVLSFSSFLLDYGLLIILTSIFGVHYLVSNTISFTVSTIFNYVLSMRYVYVRRKDIPLWREFVRFMLLSFIGLLINDTLMWFGTSFLGITYFITKILAGIIGAFWNFWSRKVFIDAS